MTNDIDTTQIEEIAHRNSKQHRSWQIHLAVLLSVFAVGGGIIYVIVDYTSASNTNKANITENANRIQEIEGLRKAQRTQQIATRLQICALFTMTFDFLREDQNRSRLLIRRGQLDTLLRGIGISREDALKDVSQDIKKLRPINCQYFSRTGEITRRENEKRDR